MSQRFISISIFLHMEKGSERDSSVFQVPATSFVGLSNGTDGSVLELHSSNDSPHFGSGGSSLPWKVSSGVSVLFLQLWLKKNPAGLHFFAFNPLLLKITSVFCDSCNKPCMIRAMKPERPRLWVYPTAISAAASRALPTTQAELSLLYFAF